MPARHPLRALRRAAVAARTLQQARRALRRGSASDALRSIRLPAGHPATPGDAAAWHTALARAGALLRADCMPRSVALCRLLAPSHTGTTLVLGTRRDASGAWVAHAWVEVAGRAVGEDVGSFARLARLAASSNWALEPVDPASQGGPRARQEAEAASAVRPPGSEPAADATGPGY